MDNRDRWRRALIETLTIVGSILLAFWVDATWEERRERAAAAAFIDVLRADLLENVSLMEASNRGSERILGATDALVYIARGDSATPSADSLVVLERLARNAGEFEPTLAAYDIGRGSAAWEYIPPSLQAQLARYAAGHSQLEIEVQVQAIVGLTAVSAAYGGGFMMIPALAEGSGGIEALMRQPEYWNWLGLNAQIVSNRQNWRLEWIQRLREIDTQLGDL